MKESKPKNIKSNITKSVMTEIKSKHIKIKPKIQVIFETLGPAGVIVLCLLIAILTLSIIFHSLLNLGLIQYLGSGKLGLIAFLGSFPHTALAASIALFMLSSYLIRTYDISYKRPYLLLITTLLLVTTASSVAIAKSRANAYLESLIESDKRSMNLLFAGSRSGSIPGAVGTISEITRDGFILKSGDTEIVVSTPQESLYNYARSLKPGDRVVVVGRRRNHNIEATSIKPLRTGKQTRQDVRGN